MDYKKEIDDFISAAERRYLSSRYGNSLNDLQKRINDFNAFIKHVDGFKANVSNEELKDAQKYITQRLTKSKDKFFK